MLGEDWRRDYNQNRPRSALGMMTPTAFSVGYRTAHRAASEHLSPLGGSEQWLAGTTTINNQLLSLQVGRRTGAGHLEGTGLYRLRRLVAELERAQLVARAEGCRAAADDACLVRR